MALRLKRVGLWYTMKDVAEKVGITPTYLLMIEKNKSVPKLKILIGLARVLEIPIVEIVQYFSDALDNKPESIPMDA